jgi:hypothetical protein
LIHIFKIYWKNKFFAAAEGIMSFNSKFKRYWKNKFVAAAERIMSPVGRISVQATRPRKGTERREKRC